MTIGTLQIQGLLIQADLLVYQAAPASPVVSTTMGSTESGGLLQGPVPTPGVVHCTTSSSVSTGSATIKASAFLLAASGIKN